ncbi:MAG TPA: precorrin-3B C(17)-methyltransferase, partial [Desulfomicrobiaceae bacterium]|nr:precorrin-3B C(17)-methyltransferase [Desulfomicrobiaceae bacterium]
KEVLSTGMRRELDRAVAAVDRAAQGRDVVVVSSGDAGVYAMAGLVLECVDRKGLFAEIECRIVPGIPALCAAAALLGAPLMHDFASISLSDLLTPWELIEQRLEAAAGADFVIVLYNPKSRRRTDQLARALTIIGRHRDGSTPVGIVRRAYRPDQSVMVGRLDEVNPEDVDMTTICLVGNSRTEQLGEWMVTPRGYFEKYELK